MSCASIEFWCRNVACGRQLGAGYRAARHLRPSSAWTGFQGIVLCVARSDVRRYTTPGRTKVRPVTKSESELGGPTVWL